MTASSWVVFGCFLFMLGLNIWLNSILIRVRKQRNKAESEMMHLLIMEEHHLTMLHAKEQQLMFYKEHIKNKEDTGK